MIPISNPETTNSRGNNGYFELPDPIEGEYIPDRPDDVAEALVRTAARMQALSFYKRALTQRLASVVPGDKRTEHIVTPGGKTVTIEHPRTDFDGPKLLAVWEKHQKSAYLDQFLRIGRINVNWRDYKTLREAEGDDKFRELMDDIKAAEIEPTSLPRIKVKVPSTNPILDEE